MAVYRWMRCVWRGFKAVKSYKIKVEKYGGVCEFVGVCGERNEV